MDLRFFIYIFCGVMGVCIALQFTTREDRRLRFFLEMSLAGIGGVFFHNILGGSVAGMVFTMVWGYAFSAHLFKYLLPRHS